MCSSVLIEQHSGHFLSMLTIDILKGAIGKVQGEPCGGGRSPQRRDQFARSDASSSFDSDCGP